jgi:hypothetical protein
MSPTNLLKPLILWGFHIPGYPHLTTFSRLLPTNRAHKWHMEWHTEIFNMNIRILGRVSGTTDKKYYSLEWGKALGQRMATGIFTYTRPKDQIQKAHNKEALVILETKRSQMVLDQQAINSGYVPIYKLKSNFLDFYNEFVKLNTRKGNRHLQNSLNSFNAFLKRDYISPIELTENLCERLGVTTS